MTDVSCLKQTACIDCPKAMVGRVIGKGGETIKALYVVHVGLSCTVSGCVRKQLHTSFVTNTNTPQATIHGCNDPDRYVDGIRHDRTACIPRFRWPITVPDPVHIHRSVDRPHPRHHCRFTYQPAACSIYGQ